MSASSINRAANDEQLQARVRALTYKEAQYNEELGGSWYGKQLNSGYANFQSLYWAVAVATEDAYQTALLSMRGAPGFDADIITDGAITSAITANWPQDPTSVAMPATVTAPAPTEPSA